MDAISEEIRKVAGGLVANALQREMIRLRKAYPRWSDSDLNAAATMSPEVTEAHRRERLALAADRRDVYAKTQVHMDTDQPGHGSASMPPVVHPSNAVRELTDPTIRTRADDLHWPTSMPPKSPGYKKLEAEAERIHRRTGLKKEQAFVQAMRDHPDWYQEDVVSRGMRQPANESMGQILSAKL